MGHDRVQRAGKLIDLVDLDLVAGVVEEVGHAADIHSVRAMRQQRVEGFEFGGAPVEHEAAATRGVQLELHEQDVAHYLKDGPEVHSLGQHGQRKKSLTHLRTSKTRVNKN